MDAAGDPDVEEINLMFASQTAKTETINNIIGHRIDRDPAPMLAIFPTDRIGQTWSKDRLGPMLRDTIPLQNLVFDRLNKRRGSGSSEILEKKFPGGILAITGANSAAGLAMRPVRDLYGDEIDRWPASAGGRGGDEGDPLLLAGKRTSNFADSLHVWASSPGVRGRSRIAKKYDQSDRARWFARCVHCDSEQILAWANVDFRDAELEKDELDRMPHEVRAARARYRCEHCDELMSDSERHESANRGRYIKQNPEVKKKRGFWVNALNSPWLSLAELVEEWLEAQGDPMLLQVFINTRLAELWDEGADRLEAEGLLGRLEAYPKDRIPNGVLLITAGCDTQKSSIEVSLVGWGLSGESWLLEHHVLNGDPALLLEGKEDSRLDDLVLDTKLTREDGVVIPIAASSIDSGGLFYEEVLAYARKRRRRRVYAIKGRAGETVPLWPLRSTKIKKTKTIGRAELFVIGVDVGKTALHYGLKRERPDDWTDGDPVPGYIHFPTRPEFDAEYFAQLAGEAPRPRKHKGRLFVEWIQEYPRVEACDCWVYARASVAAIRPNWAKLLANRTKDQVAHVDAIEALADLVDDLDDDDDDPPPRKRPEARKKRPARRRRKKAGGFATNY